jgi:hypothetical protein
MKRYLTKSTKLIGLLIVSTIVLSVLACYSSLKKPKQKNTDLYDNMRTIIFMTEQQTNEFLMKDSDGYVKQMTSSDLFARQAKTHDEYIKMISKCGQTFTPAETDKLVQCTRQADEFFASSGYIIDGKLLQKITWKLALICGTYEEGIPHTREDVIFLSRDIVKYTSEDLTSILIHEKVHIFQRYNEEYMTELLVRLGYHVAGSTSGDPRYLLRRSNPDINDTVYINPETGREMIYLYRIDKPEFIDDVIKGADMEHPYEKIAYDIGNKYLQRYLKDIVGKLR